VVVASLKIKTLKIEVLKGSIRKAYNSAEEKKPTGIPLVTASEQGSAQAESAALLGAF